MNRNKFMFPKVCNEWSTGHVHSLAVFIAGKIVSLIEGLIY